jgi:hypothetical protein
VNSRTYDLAFDFAELSKAAREFLDPEMHKYGLLPSEGFTEAGSSRHVYRGGDRFIVFEVTGGKPPTGSVRLGVGAQDVQLSELHSVSLEDLISLSLGSTGRGRYPLDQLSVPEYLHQAMNDLVEFAHEFLYGDIRSFIRMMAMSHREKHSGWEKQYPGETHGR